MVSRAWMKICEALMWGQVPLRAGDICAEIGSAPGGAAQYLLQQGMQVIAIDPAEIDPAILDHPKLKHLRRRARDVPRRDLADVRWLITDINMPPSYTLDVIEDYIGNRQMHVRGIVATLKLTDWELAKEIDSYRERIRKLGFSVIRTRQLAFNRREFCLVALRNKFERRLSKTQKRATQFSSSTVSTSESSETQPEEQPLISDVESDSEE
jgi:23S rRNA (cytidine2498-2'-O)-methyltransferase